MVPDPVELRPDLVPFWNAYNWLCRRRKVSSAPTPIEIVEIQAYLDEYLYRAPSQRQLMIRLIDEMDDVWLSYVRGRAKDGDSQGSDRRERRPARR